jgi:SAM-dependent methyltransferase
VSVDQKRALAAVWTDREAAESYRFRAPYPAPVFDVLRRLAVAPYAVLDVGAGTGAVTRGVLSFASRVDAVEPSEAMLAEARRLPGGDDRRIHWILGTAETARLAPPYGLITCGQSLHWMDHDVVMPRFAAALLPGGVLAALDREWEYPPEWRAGLVEIIQRYSPLKDPPLFVDLFGELQRRGLFDRLGFQRTSVISSAQTVDDFVRALQSTSTLSRVTLGDRTDAFATDVRALFERLGIDRVVVPVAGNVVWGRPKRP